MTRAESRVTSGRRRQAATGEKPRRQARHPSMKRRCARSAIAQAATDAPYGRHEDPVAVRAGRSPGTGPAQPRSGQEGSPDGFLENVTTPDLPQLRPGIGPGSQEPAGHRAQLPRDHGAHRRLLMKHGSRTSARRRGCTTPPQSRPHLLPSEGPGSGSPSSSQIPPSGIPKNCSNTRDGTRTVSNPRSRR